MEVRKPVTHEQLFAHTAVRAWKLTVDRLDQMFRDAQDDDLLLPVAPGRNRVFYLLGHLTAVHDRMLPLLGLGQRLHPELDADFLDRPDDPESPDRNRLPASALRRAWSDVNARLTAAIEALPHDAWLERHAAVSDEEFAKEPHRNRLSVLLSRTTHAGYHQGQVTLALKER